MTNQDRINEITADWDHVEGVEADDLYEELIALEDALCDKEAADQEYADADNAEFVRQAFVPQHHRL